MIGIKNRLQEAHSKSQFIPTGNQTIYGDALDQINELEHERDQLREELSRARLQNARRLEGLCKCGLERDQLREQVKMLRDVLQFYMDNGICEPLYHKAKEALAATEEKK